jgi:hypothetical protein
MIGNMDVRYLLRMGMGRKIFTYWDASELGVRRYYGARNIRNPAYIQVKTSTST